MRQSLWSRNDAGARGEVTRYNFLVNRPGLHEICIANRESSDRKINLYLQILSIASGNDSQSQQQPTTTPTVFDFINDNPMLDALDIPSLLTIDNLHNDITVLALDLSQILDEQRATRMRLNQRRQISESTNRSVLFVSSAEVVVTLLCALLQVVFVRRLFVKT
jgi:hypothetical protein